MWKQVRAFSRCIQTVTFAGALAVVVYGCSLVGVHLLEQPLYSRALERQPPEEPLSGKDPQLRARVRGEGPGRCPDPHGW